jgi:hypothetical protein
MRLYHPNKNKTCYKQVWPNIPLTLFPGPSKSYAAQRAAWLLETLHRSHLKAGLCGSEWPLVSFCFFAEGTSKLITDFLDEPTWLGTVPGTTSDKARFLGLVAIVRTGKQTNKKWSGAPASKHTQVNGTSYKFAAHTDRSDRQKRDN